MPPPTHPAPTLLDGAMGTVLEASGLALPAPDWSAHAVAHHPEALLALHRDYAAAGAEVLTACTFRTRDRALGSGWRALARAAMRLARQAADEAAGEVRVAGSLAPLEDCWHPERSPPDPGPEHQALAEALAEEGADLLLCETFPHVEEGLAAARAAASTGLPVWLSFTAGPAGDLLSLSELEVAFERAAGAGASAVLINCVPLPVAHRAAPLLADVGLPWGIYPNAGLGSEPVSPADFAAAALEWVEAGASIVGGCCGTTPEHLRVLVAALDGLE